MHYHGMPSEQRPDGGRKERRKRKGKKRKTSMHASNNNPRCFVVFSLFSFASVYGGDAAVVRKTRGWQCQRTVKFSSSALQKKRKKRKRVHDAHFSIFFPLSSLFSFFR